MAEESKFNGYLVQVVEVEKNKTGIYGEINQIRCKILEGRDKDRIIRRNVFGPIKVNDIIRLPDTSREAKEIKVK